VVLLKQALACKLILALEPLLWLHILRERSFIKHLSPTKA
jgi:hypothetical protein